MQECQPLCRHLLIEKIDTVALPPGLARLATRPSLIGLSPIPKTIGIVAVAALAATAADAESATIMATRPDQISHQRRQAIVLALHIMVFDRHVLALDVTGFAKPLAERGHIARCGIGRPGADVPNNRHRRLLRPRHHRPRRRAPEPRDECSPLH
jgi:hypothetical protein